MAGVLEISAAAGQRFSDLVPDELRGRALAAELDGVTYELFREVPHSGGVRFLTFDDDGGRRVFRHTTTHIMAQAVKRLHPQAQFAIGPALEQGYYYDMWLPEPLTESDLAAIEAAAVFKRNAAAAGLDRVAEARLPLTGAETARLIAFRPRDGGSEHLAILIGAPDPAAPVLVRLHSECFIGDLLASLRCDHGDQLRGAIAVIARAGNGVLLYLAQEERGVGVINKLRAYHLQDAGFDTLDANEQLGFDADERIYLPAAEMIRQLGFGTVRLLTNNQDEAAALERYGIRVAERVPHVFPSNRHNEWYLRTKATRRVPFL